MEIEEIKKAKIKLEHDIEVLLNKFDKSCKTKTISIIHSYSHPLAFGGSDLDQVFHAIELKIEI